MCLCDGLDPHKSVYVEVLGEAGCVFADGAGVWVKSLLI